MTVARPVIIFLDHDGTSVSWIVSQFRERSVEGEKFSDRFQFETIEIPVPKAGAGSAKDQMQEQVSQIVDRAVVLAQTLRGNAVLIDLSFDAIDSDPYAVARGTAIAARLQRLLPNACVGVYSRHGLKDDEDITLSLERFAVVLPRLNERLGGGRHDPGPTRWLEILKGLVGEASAETPPQPAAQPYAIFIAHAHANAPLAAAMKGLICVALGLRAETVFVTSEAPELRPGESVSAQLAENIAGAKVLLALVTAESKCAPFVWFELGLAHCRGWHTPRAIAAFSSSGKTFLNETPVAGVMATDLTKKTDVMHLIKQLAETCRLRSLDLKYYTALVDSVVTLANDAETSSAAGQPPR